MSDKIALEHLFHQTMLQNDPLLQRICCVYSSPRASSEDLYQEVAAALWIGLKSFRGQSALSTWVYRVAINTCISFLRRNDSMKLRTQPLENIDISEETQFSSTDELAFLQLLISKLDPMDKALILLWLEEKSYSEMSEVTGLSPTAIGARLTRIRHRLRRLSEKELESKGYE